MSPGNVSDAGQKLKFRFPTRAPQSAKTENKRANLTLIGAAEAINAKRALLRQVAVILETSESELLADFVKLLYRRVTISEAPGESAIADACAGNGSSRIS